LKEWYEEDMRVGGGYESWGRHERGMRVGGGSESEWESGMGEI
tara:strand:+ start:873 stop:1001 length:129 start_codon:yes stop_codon:yes gene_type:complete